MYFALVNNIWLGGSGAVILGGLYWRKGTSQAALWTLILGAVMGVAGVVITQFWSRWTGKEFPVNPQWIWFITMTATTVIYYVFSLAGNENFNMDKLLHRGKYAIAEDQTHINIPAKWYDKIFGITHEFSRFDRFIAYAIVGWFLAWMLVFAVGMVYGKVAEPGEIAWSKFWRIYLYILFGLAIVSTIWFTLGGLRDMKNLFHTLKHQERDYNDTGLIHHDSADDHTESE